MQHLSELSGKILDFSQEILDMSKSHIIKKTNLVDVSALIQKCVDSYFVDTNTRFEFEGLNQRHLLHLQWVKFEQVLINIFTNSREAVSDKPLKIQIKLVPSDYATLIKIEDNGIGCTAEQEKEIFKAFYTTKSGKQGTGLGLAMAKNIVEAHGGRISAYSKNLEDNEETGLKIFITFPKYHTEGEREKEDKGQFVVVKSGITTFEHVVKTLSNVYAEPYIVKTHEDLFDPDIRTKVKKILATPETFLHIRDRLDPSVKVFLVSSGGDKTYVMNDRSHPEVFSEEFVLSKILND
jgi:hypothetical protein